MTTPKPEDGHNGALGPLFASDPGWDAGRLWLDLVGLIPTVIANTGGLVEYGRLEQELLGNQLAQFSLDQIPIMKLSMYIEALGGALMTLQRTGVIEYTKAVPLLFLRLAGDHE